MQTTNNYNSQSPQPNTPDWYRARLGNITGSAVGNLMSRPRSKSETWSETAKTYLAQIAFERGLNPSIINDDELFAQYLELMQVRSKAITWGHTMEANAAGVFADKFAAMHHPDAAQPLKPTLTEPSSIKCQEPGLTRFASTPDRAFFDPYTGEQSCVEIKCPQGKSYSKYVREVYMPTDYAEALEGLRHAEPLYYWQCFAHMLCTGASKTYFVIYNPFLLRPIHSICIERDEEVIGELRERVIQAEQYLSTITI